MKTITCSVQGTITDTPLLVVDSGYSVAPIVNGTQAIFSVDSHQTGGFGINAGGKYFRDDTCVLPADPNGSLTGPTLIYARTLPRLNVVSDCFTNDKGEKVPLGLSTDFRLFEQYLAGGNIDAVINQRTDAGAEGFRVFGTCKNLFTLDPRDHSDYYARLQAFVRYLAEKGHYVHFTALTDVQLMRSGFDPRDHWNDCCDALADEPNVVVMELVNEWFKNGVDPTKFNRPARAPQAVSCGSFVDGQFAPAGWGNVLTFHPSRNKDKWDVTVPQTVQEIRAHDGNYAVWIGEPMGAASAPRADRSTDVARFERLGITCGVFAAGGVFHSDAGLQSALWSGIETECARAFFRGVHR